MSEQGIASLSVEKISIRQDVEHWAGARLTRRDWRPTLVLSDGSEVCPCPHAHGHRTTDAAIRCGTAGARKMPVVTP